MQIPKIFQKSFHKRVLRNYLVKKIPLFTGCEHCASAISPLKERICLDCTVNFPIDVVYTWVDGSDKDHFQKRLTFMKNKKYTSDGVSNARFRNSDELRYSLRSIQEYAPWVNHIYIVTDNQIPHWLNRHSGKITIIDHKDIIPAQYLPTFNSHVIECYLHTIKGLSEHFIYFNDDFFLTAEAKPEYFFTSNGIPIVYVDWRQSRLEGYLALRTPHAHSYFNVLKALHERKTFAHMGKFSFFIAQHGPSAQTKQNAIETFAFFQKDIQAISGNKFRTNGEIAFYSHAIPMYAAHAKKCVLCDDRYFYINISKVDRRIYYEYMVQNKNNDCMPLYISLNDTVDSNGNTLYHDEMQEFLKKYYIMPSGFERM